MNLRRFVLTAAAATLATAALTSAAQAATTNVLFAAKQGYGRVSLGSSPAHTRFDLIRSGAVVGSTTNDLLEVGGLVAKDMVALYNGNAIVATIVYDGTPVIGDDACIGRTSFQARRAPNAEIRSAGMFVAPNGADEDGTWTADETAVVTLPRPLGSADMAWVETYANDGQTAITSVALKAMQLCFEKPTRTPPTETPPQPQPPVAPTELTPTGAQMTQAVKGSLAATGSSLRTRTTRRLARSSAVALPFAFPEPGTVELQLVAKNQVIGSGRKSSAVNGKVILSVQLTRAGRKLLKRSKKLKVTVKGTFTATRIGAESSRASSTVTLKR